mmetsp:Transcript_5234/g.5448  ORF Transcript_5234/g.5448 Transcript_5234/m.5448 type:complete len:203 (+) Transcript_5234:1112-1720(+)
MAKKTVEKDDCTLTVRRVELPPGQAQPVRVVIDPSLSLILRSDDANFAMLRDGLPVVIYYSSTLLSKSAEFENIMSKFPDAVKFVDLSDKKINLKSNSVDSRFLSPKAIVEDLSSRGINHIMVEGGPATALAFLRNNLVDRAIIVKAPIQFKDPVPSSISEKEICQAGLVKLGQMDSGGDTIEWWSRPERAWPISDDSLWWP